MKKIILLSALLCSSSLFAANVEWGNLIQENEYKITQNVVFENGVTLPSGESYDLLEVEPISIPGYPMLYFGFQQKDCVNPDQTADISIIEVPGLDGNVEVGAQLNEGCILGLYLETKDIFSTSAFEE